jgi:nicotinate-nucleotide pyrophosphorylase (carboxylating)
VAILDTRKTTPLWRDLEKAAVVCGGGANHRFGLFDRVMIKDNHVACWAAQQAGDLAAAVAQARAAYPDLLVEVEVDRLEQLDAVLPERPDWVLLDNMTPQQVREGVARCRGIARVEVSGGITLETVAAFAAAEPDAISVGALTHSVVAADVGLDWESAS